MTQFFARAFDETGKIADVEIQQNLGIKILHEGKEYTLSVNNNDELVLRALDGVMVVLPQASNSIILETRK